MTNIFDFVLRKIGPTQWGIYSSKGHEVHILGRCLSEKEALSRANVWVSSWSGSTLRVERTDEQDNKTD